jgi:23S rRNA pseudouridine1911/1915/1917 synthase
VVEPVESFVVPDTLDGERVDRAVALVSGWARADVQVLIERGDVRVGGEPVAKSRRLRAGDLVEVRAVPAPDAPPAPDPAVPIDVRHADADIVVVAKPAGMVVHPGAGHNGGTLVHGLLARFPELAEVGAPDRPGIVHRLDRDTSGLLVVARSARAYESLVAQLAARAVERRYDALVWGHLAAPRGLVDAPIGRSQARRTRMAVRDEGREARTEYQVREVFDDPRCSLLTCRLETGRTHQIRVHLSAIGHPVVGDATYGGARPSLPLERPFLHASRLGFAHPASGAWLTFEDPLPAALQAVLDRLRSGQAPGASG